MSLLFSPLNKGALSLRNRVVLPPIVMFSYSDVTGKVSPRNIEHYEKYAKTDLGLMITEALAIHPQHRLSADQLGVWSDEFIPGLATISETAHRYGNTILAQIHHAGYRSVADKAGPTAYDTPSLKARALSLEEIEKVKEDFVKAALRIKQAGFDGVEIHGAHGYLLSDFFSNRMNKRDDKYGGTPLNRAALACEVIAAVKKACGDNFITGIRFSANEEGYLEMARALETAGAQYIHASFGWDNLADTMDAAGDVASSLFVPEDWPFLKLHYYTSQIKKITGVPVIAVNSIHLPEDAEKALVAEVCDLVAMARPLLVEPDWALLAKAGKPIQKCLRCKNCKWFGRDGEKTCPGRLLRNRNTA